MPQPRADAFRIDIQGLRAIAVLLVLAYHLWPGAVTGGFVGVDAFFVISGFLITAHLLQHPPRTGRDLLGFWGRRVRRILPAALVVLAATAVASRLVLPDTRWATNAGQIVASALYVQNWVLAANSVDYLAAAEPPTPVQHYWSLSIEEQFYLGWPILLLAAFWLAWRLRTGSTWLPRLAMAAIVAGSLWWSITATATDPASAYFITPTRVWELGAGGVLATLPSLASLRRPEPLASGLAWVGLALVFLAGVAFGGSTPFPGSAALVPVGGTALVILAAASGPWSPTRFLGNRAIQHIGDTSYSIYLWHWPLIALWPYAFGPITPIAAVTIVAATLGLATLSKTFVEDTFRFAPAFQGLQPTFRLAAVGMVLVSLLGGGELLEAQLRLDAAAATTAGNQSLETPDDTPSAVFGGSGAPSPPATGSTPRPRPTSAAQTPIPSPLSCVGAAAIVQGFGACPQDPAATLVAPPEVAATDRSAAYRDGCWNYAPFTTQVTCQYGTGPIKVALVGNSHAGQWLPALIVLARHHGWTLTTFLASQCNATDASLEFYSATKTAGCLAYGRWVMDQTKGHAFDLVVTSERQSVPVEGDTWAQTRTSAAAGYATYLKRWSDAGTNVVVLQDTPYPGQTLPSVPDCVAAHLTNQAACAGTPADWAWQDPFWAAANAPVLPGVTPIPTTRYLCTDTTCPAVIGGVIVFFDASHMTATYARSIAPFLDPAIEAALNRPA